MMRFECDCGFWREYEDRAPSIETIRKIHTTARPYCSRVPTAAPTGPDPRTDAAVER